MSLYLPGAVWRPISYRTEAGKFTTPPLGYIPHVPVSNGSLFAYFNRLVSPNRKFSTSWLAKDGRSEQYQSLDMKPWAQAAGNGQYHAFEVEGYPNEPYTAAQINTLAIWHNFLGTPDVLANAPGQRGIGTHYMGGAAWGGHSCPDPAAGAGPRSKQRAAIIARAIVLRGHVAPVTGKLVVNGVLDLPTRKRWQQWASVTQNGVLGFNTWHHIQVKVGVTPTGYANWNTWNHISRLVGAGPTGGPDVNTLRHLQTYLNSH